MRLFTCLILPLVLAGCQLLGTTGEEVLPCSDGPLCTDKTSYEAEYEDGEGINRRYGFDLVASFKNVTDETVYLQRCDNDSATPTYSVSLSGDREQRSAYNLAWACVGGVEPFELQPGEVRVDKLHITGPNGWSDGEWLGLLEGGFRLSYAAYSCREFRNCRLPEEQRTSRVFEVRLAD